MNNQADVVFALAGDVRRNSRAIRQLRALTGRGLSVVVLSIAEENGPRLEIAGVELLFLKPPKGQGPRYFWRIHRATQEAAVSIDARVYHASDLYTLPGLARAARTHGRALVYDARELYPHVAATVGRPWARYFWRMLERQYIREASAVLTVSSSIADKLVELYHVISPVVIHNIPDVSDFQSATTLRERAGLRSDDVVLLHQGQMRPYRGCELLVEAMPEVSGAVLVFLGDGPMREALEKRAAELGVADRVRFVESVPPDELLSYTAGADIGLTLLDDVCLNHRFALPNKLFEYLVAGIPVVASDLPEVRRVVLDFDVGLVVRSSSRGDLVAALRQASIDKSLRETWRRNIPRVLETFNSENASHDFLQVYDELLPRT